jgi:holliday junction DNA helicase RuvB
MTERLQVTTPEAMPEETGADAALRPSRLDEFVGQEQVKISLQIAIDAAKQRRETLDHTLFFGPPGLGKTTLAMLMAREMGVQIRTTSGPVLEKPGDLVGLLTSLGPGDMLFIDEIHRMKPALEEFLYPAMEDYRVDVRIAEGPHAQTIPMALERFTLIGATTRFGLLTPPMRARFGLVERLGFYPADDLQQIVTRSAGILQVPIDHDGSAEIARRSRGTPRVANRLLRRVRDYAQVRADGRITAAVADAALARLNVDEFGLDDMDARILTTIIEKFGGGPVGLGTVAVAVGEDAGTLQDVYEPYLIQQGFLERTPRGRCATALAYRRFGLTPPAGQHIGSAARSWSTRTSRTSPRLSRPVTSWSSTPRRSVTRASSERVPRARPPRCCWSNPVATAPGSRWAGPGARCSPASGSRSVPAPRWRRWRCCPTGIAGFASSD